MNDALIRTVLGMISTLERQEHRVRPPAVNFEAIVSFQNRFRTTLPDSVIAYLSKTDGAQFGELRGPYEIEKRSSKESCIDDVLTLYDGFISRMWIPVASDGCANYYVLVGEMQEDRPVCFVDTLSSIENLQYVVASGYWHFLRFFYGQLCGETFWPSDQRRVQELDPDIARVDVASPIWNCK